MTPARFAFACLLPILAGCGTFRNLNEMAEEPAPQQVYGGVAIAKKQFKPMTREQPTAPLLWPLQAGDVVLSAIGDTVTLPWTISAEVERGVTASYFPDRPIAVGESEKTWRVRDESKGPAPAMPSILPE